MNLINNLHLITDVPTWYVDRVLKEQLKTDEIGLNTNVDYLAKKYPGFTLTRGIVSLEFDENVLNLASTGNFPYRRELGLDAKLIESMIQKASFYEDHLKDLGFKNIKIKTTGQEIENLNYILDQYKIAN